MIDKRYETIIGEVREISSDIARLDADLTKDRQELQDFQIKIATLTGEVEQLRKEFKTVINDVGDKVKESLEPAVAEVKRLKKEIGEKKTIALKTVSLWSFLKFKRNNEKKAEKN